MPRAVVFGPTKYGGMEWDSPLSITLFEQVKLIVGSLRLGDTVGKLLSIQLTWIQLIAGIETPILDEKKSLKYVPTGWITTLRDKLRPLKIDIEIENVWVPRIQRENDWCIMEYVQKSLPELMWNSINLCRLYLQAVTLVDITTFDGTTVALEVYEVKKAYRDSRLKFPISTRPRKEDRNQWIYFLCHLINSWRELYVPLGKWLQVPYQIFPYVLDPRTKIVYKKKRQRRNRTFTILPVPGREYMCHQS